MKRINSMFELFVLVIFFDPLVANPPMWGGGGSSSSSAVKTSEPWIYGLESLTRVYQAMRRTWQNPRIYIEHSDDAAKFKYKLLGAHNELAFENTGRGTNLLFLFGKKMKIRAIDNIDVLFKFDFEEVSEANLVADYILSADSARYKKCTGSNTYKVEKLYKTSTTGSPTDVEENLCVFKSRADNASKFVVRRMAPNDDQPLTVFVLRLKDLGLSPLRDDSSKLELSVYADNRQLLQPTYVLETPKPGKLLDFFYKN